MNLRSVVVSSLIVLSAPAGARAQTPSAVATEPAPPDAPTIPLRLAAQIELASGVATGSFRNELVGGRLDGRFSPHLSLGGYLGLADLKGKDGRLRAALTYAQLEYLAGEPSSWLRFPLRFATGYLTENGPVVRAAAGLSFSVGRSVDLVTELAPMVWLTNNQTLLSLNLALELAFRL